MNDAIENAARRRKLLAMTPDASSLKRGLQRDGRSLSSASTASTKVTPEAKRQHLPEEISPAVPKDLFPPTPVSWLYLMLFLFWSDSMCVTCGWVWVKHNHLPGSWCTSTCCCTCYCRDQWSAIQGRGEHRTLTLVFWGVGDVHNIIGGFTIT